jgi:hypothetical protein
VCVCVFWGGAEEGEGRRVRLVAGLEEPTGGRIYFDDLDATDLPVQDRQVGGRGGGGGRAGGEVISEWGRGAEGEVEGGGCSVLVSQGGWVLHHAGCLEGSNSELNRKCCWPQVLLAPAGP